MRRLTPVAWIAIAILVLLIVSAFVLTHGCAAAPPKPKPAAEGHPSDLPGGGWQTANAPPYPAPTKVMDQSATAKSAAPRQLVPYAVVGQRYHDNVDGTRIWFVKLQAPSGERFEVQADKETFARAAFDKRLCLADMKAIVCP
jgi:hypothetical protein